VSVSLDVWDHSGYSISTIPVLHTLVEAALRFEETFHWTPRWSRIAMSMRRLFRYRLQS
jgi:hypothetical protein